MPAHIPLPMPPSDDFPLDPVLKNAGPTSSAVAPIEDMDVDDPLPEDLSDRGQSLPHVDSTRAAASHDTDSEHQYNSIGNGVLAHHDRDERNIPNNMAMLRGLGIDQAPVDHSAVSGKPGKENYVASDQAKAGPKAPIKKGKKGKKKAPPTPGATSVIVPETREQLNELAKSSAPSLPTPISNSATDPSRRTTRSVAKSTCIDTKERLKLVATQQRKWMGPAVEALNAALGPAQENGVVDLWIKFETVVGKKGMKKKLTADGQPWQLEDWISRGRNYESPPPIDKAPAYASAWRRWWASMQPSWRMEGGTWPMLKKDVEGEGWLNVKKGGANGIVLAILGASWWYAQCGVGNERDECEEAIVDICWVLEKMIAACVASEDDEDDDRAAKRYVLIWLYV